MKMLLVSEVFPPQTGGSGRWFWEVYRRLPRESVLVAAGEHPRAAQFDAAHDVPCVRLPLAMREWGLRSVHGLWDYGRLTRRLRDVIREGRVEAVHAARCLPEGWLAWMLRRLTGIPYLLYAHGEDVQAARASREHSWMVRRVLRDASLVIANSRNTARLLRDPWHVDAGKVRVLHPGVDTKRFVPARPDAAVRRRLGWEGRPVILTVGRLQRRKGQDMLIEALRLVRQRVPNVLYAIVGDGGERPRLAELICQHGLAGNVQMLGELHDEDLVNCYQQCDLFALPNREVDGDIEGFGMVLLEAQACGKPVLAGDSGGTCETMRPASAGNGLDVIRAVANAEGSTGIVVDCTRVEPLADAVTQLLTDAGLRERMGSAARAWTVDRFSWQHLTAEAAELFQSVGRKSSRAVAGQTPQVTPEQVSI